MAVDFLVAVERAKEKEFHDSERTQTDESGAHRVGLNQNTSRDDEPIIVSNNS